jgi:hypothetical protein
MATVCLKRRLNSGRAGELPEKGNPALLYHVSISVANGAERLAKFLYIVKYSCYFEKKF